MSNYKISITQADFLSPEQFIKTHTKDNIEVVVEDVEFEGTEDVHTSGYTVRTLLSSDFNSLSDEIEGIFNTEYLRGECFGVYLKNGTKEVFTEMDFDWWS
jgi:hypothetical protein